MAFEPDDIIWNDCRDLGNNLRLLIYVCDVKSNCLPENDLTQSNWATDRYLAMSKSVSRSGKDKMAAILQKKGSKCNFLNETFDLGIKFSWKVNGSVDNSPAFFQIMSWRRTGAESISEQKMV